MFKAASNIDDACLSAFEATAYYITETARLSVVLMLTYCHSMSELKILSDPMPRIGVGGIVFNRRREVLLIRRNKPPADGLWSVPGGQLEPGESVIEACSREVEEETGLVVKPQVLVAVVERRVEQYHYIVLDFWAHLVGGEATQPVARSDVSDARWIALTRLDEYSLVPGLQEIILRTDRLVQQGKRPGLIDPTGRGTDFIPDMA